MRVCQSGPASLHKCDFDFLAAVRSPHKIPHPSFHLPTVMVSYCSCCQQLFGDDRTFEQHREDSNHWACDDCKLEFWSCDCLRQHYAQDPDHHYCKECDRHFNFEESRRQHMDAKHWYCRQHDWVSAPRYQQIYCRDLFFLAPSRSSSPKMAFIRTIDRAWTTTFASSVKRTLMTKMSCGTTQLRITMPAGTATK
jgi:hypothetical protein